MIWECVLLIYLALSTSWIIGIFLQQYYTHMTSTSSLTPMTPTPSTNELDMINLQLSKTNPTTTTTATNRINFSPSKTISISSQQCSLQDNGTTLIMSNQNLVVIPVNIKQQLMDYKETITTIDLSHNKLTSIPSWFLQFFTQVQHLNLSHNLFFELPNNLWNNQLQTLQLQYNKFEYIPLSVLKMKQLKQLNISHNYITIIGDDFVEACSETLQDLNLSHNQILKLSDKFVQMKQLKQFEFANNKFMNRVYHILEQLMIKNTSLKQYFVNKKSEKEEEQQVMMRRMSQFETKQLFEKRIQASMELIETEKRYVQFLKLLYEEFYLPLVEKNAQNSSQLHLIPLSNTVDVNRLFPPHLNVILNFNNQLYQELCKVLPISSQGSDLSKLHNAKLSVIFLERIHFFKIYSDYISNYETCNQYLIHCIESNLELKQGLQRAKEQIKELNGLDLQSLIVMPIQRIPRYLLLLNNIQQFTRPDHPDYDKMQEAIKKMQEIANVINKKIAEAASRSKVAEIAKEWNDMSLIEAHRHVVREQEEELIYQIIEIVQDTSIPPTSPSSKITPSSPGPSTTPSLPPTTSTISQQIKLILFNDLLGVVKYRGFLEQILGTSMKQLQNYFTSTPLSKYNLYGATVKEETSKDTSDSFYFSVHFKNDQTVMFMTPKQETRASWIKDIQQTINSRRHSMDHQHPTSPSSSLLQSEALPR